MYSLKILDESFKEVAEIDEFKSAVFEMKFRDIGRFEIVLNFDPKYFEYMNNDWYIVHPIDNKQYYLIETVSLRQVGVLTEELLVTGRHASSLLDRRILDGLYQTNMYAERTMAIAVQENTSWWNRSFASTMKFVNVPPFSSPKPSIRQQSTGKNLATWLTDFSAREDVNLGWTLEYDAGWNALDFKVLQYVDRSSLQTTNGVVEFSEIMNNVVNQFYAKSYVTHKNTAYVAGAGEGFGRKRAVVNNSNLHKNRREVYIDARDLTDKREDGTTIPTLEYDEMLSNRGRPVLASLPVIENFDCDVYVDGSYTFRFDYSLGDRVTVKNDRWGVVMHPQILGVTEIFEKGQVVTRVQFGDMLPTPTEISNRKVNDY